MERSDWVPHDWGPEGGNGVRRGTSPRVNQTTNARGGGGGGGRPPRGGGARGQTAKHTGGGITSCRMCEVVRVIYPRTATESRLRISSAEGDEMGEPRRPDDPRPAGALLKVRARRHDRTQPKMWSALRTRLNREGSWKGSVRSLSQFSLGHGRAAGEQIPARRAGLAGDAAPLALLRYGITSPLPIGG